MCAAATQEGAEETRLSKAVRPLVDSHPGLSGIFPLREGRDAFAARALLADAAERTLDLQYYIWHDDMSGTLLFRAARRAADRGVRVRLLLDDNNSTGLDATIATLSAHPKIEVRLFNPFFHRRWRLIDYFADFSRLNRRMHNKSFIADGQVTIIGGRNVGDEYFEAAHDVLFVDLDVLAVGPVVADVSLDFDRYWKSGSACPAETVLAPVSDASRAEVTAAASRAEGEKAAEEYSRAVAASPFVRDLLARELNFDWAITRMVSDDPAKGLGRAPEKEHLWGRLTRILDAPKTELQLISPYFVPGAQGIETFAALARDGVKITVLTNSLEATDVVAVHAGYAKRRKPLLECGVTLFEMKRASPVPSGKDRGLTGSSGSSLHAKTFSVDRARVFIGSFNFDPRSAKLNTELGFVIDSPALAQAMTEAFAGPVLARAYEVRLAGSGSLEWVERTSEGETVHRKEPGVSPGRLLAVRVLSWLPIEWLL
ncbi:MAG: phospholipase D family protein [Acidobacteriota bacterium]